MCSGVGRVPPAAERTLRRCTCLEQRMVASRDNREVIICRRDGAHARKLLEGRARVSGSKSSHVQRECIPALGSRGARLILMRHDLSIEGGSSLTAARVLCGLARRSLSVNRTGGRLHHAGAVPVPAPHRVACDAHLPVPCQRQYTTAHQTNGLLGVGLSVPAVRQCVLQRDALLCAAARLSTACQCRHYGILRRQRAKQACCTSQSHRC